MEEINRYELLKSKLKCECPYLQKCCFCVPLRKGLLVFGYVKLVSACLLIGFAFMPITWMIFTLTMEGGMDFLLLIIVILSVAVLVTDLAFSLVAVLAAHKKSWKSMKTSYYYTISYLITLTILFILFIIYFRDNLQTRNWHEHEVVIFTIVVYILDACIHCYLVTLVRSAAYKFENDFNFRYVRNVDEEPVCVMET